MLGEGEGDGLPPPPPPGELYGASGGTKRQVNGGVEHEPGAKRAHTEGAGPDTVLRLLLSEGQLEALERPAAAGGQSARSALDAAAGETGAAISVITATVGCEERVAVVYAAACGVPDAACTALQRLAAALMPGGGAETVRQPPAEDLGGPCKHRLRLLASASQAAGLTGSDAEAMAAIEDGSGVQLEVHPPERAPMCALEGDHVVEVSALCGEAVAAALERLSDHLRRHPPKERPGGVSQAMQAALRLADGAAGGPGGGAG